MRRGVRRVEDVLVGRCHVAGGQRLAVVKRRAVGGKVEAVMIAGQALPGRERRHRARVFVEVDQPLVEQPVDARRGGVGGEARIEIDRLARQSETDDVIGRLGTGGECEQQRQTGSQQEFIHEHPFFTAETHDCMETNHSNLAGGRAMQGAIAESRKENP